MSQFEQLDRMSKTNGGVLTTAAALEAGISKSVLSKYVAVNEYERVSHGIYLAPDAWPDRMYILSLRCPQIVFSHDTALFFHDLTDREPIRYSVTTKTGYNPTHLSTEGVKVYTINKALYEVGVGTGETPFGHCVPVYNIERTVCDMVRSRSGMEAQTLQGALKQYACRQDKDLLRLMEYAKLFHVERILRQYLEVLL